MVARARLLGQLALGFTCTRGLRAEPVLGSERPLGRPELEHLAAAAQRLAHGAPAVDELAASRAADEPEAAGHVAHLPAGAAISPRSRSASAKSRVRARLLPPPASSTISGGASSRSASEPSPKSSSAASEQLRWLRAHSWKTASASGVLKSSSSTAASRSQLRRPPARDGRAEDVAERLDLRRRLRDRVVARSRSACASARSGRRGAASRGPTRRALSRIVDDVPERLRHLLAGEARASRCASRSARTRGRARATAPARSRGGGRRGRGRRRGSRTPARAAPRPSPSTRCASPAGRGPTASPTHVSSPASFAFQSAKSRGSSFAGSAPAPRPARAAARQPPVARVARDAEVDVALDRVGVAALDQLLDERDDRGRSSRSPSAAWSGMPRPRSPVSSRYHSVARAASSALAPARRRRSCR